MIWNYQDRPQKAGLLRLMHKSQLKQSEKDHHPEDVHMVEFKDT